MSEGFHPSSSANPHRQGAVHQRAVPAPVIRRLEELRSASFERGRSR